MTSHSSNDPTNDPSRNPGTGLMDDDARQLYQSLVQELPVYAVCKNLKGQYTFVSRRYAAKLETSPDEAIGKTDFDFYPKQLALRFQAEDEQVIQSEETLVLTDEDTTGDEPKYFALRKGPVYSEDGMVVGVQTIFWDVTDQKKAEIALLNERNLLQTIMDQLPDFIYVKDRAGHYVVVNEGVRKILGADSVSEVIGKTNFDYVPHDQAELERLDDAQVFERGEALIDREECMTGRDGGELWILTSKLPLRDASGKITGLVGIDRNITRLKATEAELRSAKVTADKANQAKGDFLANMSHEIRTPMNAIIGMTDLLLETQLTATQREYLAMVQDSGEALLALINDILDFSKIESGKFELEITSFDIRETLGDTMKSLGLRAYKKGIELAVNVDREIPNFLKADPGRIRQIIVNLVGNAIKFTEQGEIVLEINCQSKTDDQVTLHFTVTDTGVGIARETCEKIFDKFEQADASTTRRFGGTGLGLAICSRLVALMGGRIWVESEIGKGSQFHFTATMDIDHEQQKHVVEQPVDVQGMRVLVVDDNATNRRILKEMLTNWGMAPVTASGAPHAIQLLLDAVDEQDPFKLVISDVNMPGTDGIQLAEQITTQKPLAETAIIMLTSGARPDDTTRLRSMGVEYHLMKPIKQSELFGAMVSTLGESETAVGTPIEISTPDSPNMNNKPLRILLAEDNVVNQKLAMGILNGLGHEVKVAGNGVAAVNSFTREEFDLVLMDVQMPEMDGLTATRKIRTAEALTGTHVPIVAMTAHAMKGDREQCLQAGMDDYLTKPIRLQEIADKLREMFPVTRDSVAEQTTSTGAKSQSGPINWDLALKSVGGSRDLFYEVVVAFLDDTPRLITTAEDAVDLKDPVALCAAAHSLRGSLLFLNANEAYECARRMELFAGESDLEKARAELLEFKAKYSQIRRLLDAYVTEHAPNNPAGSEPNSS